MRPRRHHNFEVHTYLAWTSAPTFETTEKKKKVNVPQQFNTPPPILQHIENTLRLKYVSISHSIFVAPLFSLYPITSDMLFKFSLLVRKNGPNSFPPHTPRPIIISRFSSVSKNKKKGSYLWSPYLSRSPLQVPHIHQHQRNRQLWRPNCPDWVDCLYYFE